MARVNKRKVTVTLGILGCLLVVALGARLLVETFGLEREIYPHRRQVAGEPIVARVEPRLTFDRKSLARHVRAPAFTLRWHGWIRITEAGEYRFSTRSASPSRLTIGGELVVDNPGGQRPRTLPGATSLLAGIYPIELSFHHAPGREMTLATLWQPPTSEQGPIPAAQLFASRPGPLERPWRHAISGLSRAMRKVVGCLLLLAGAAPLIFLTHARGAGLLRQIRRRLPDHLLRWWTPGRTTALLALALFLAAFLGTLPLGGSPYGFDDIRYMHAAEFTQAQSWITNRYAHVYLLKGLTALAGGDPFDGSEVTWSFIFAATVVCMFLSIRAIGPRLQLPTFAVALFLLFSQRMFFRHIGAAYADLSAMLFVMIGTALFLVGQARGWPRGGRWYAFGIGLVTVWATKSKELGAVLLWLLPLLAFHNGRLALARFVRRGAYWAGGAVAALAILMALDGALLGDPLFGVRPNNLDRVGSFNFAGQPQEERTEEGWIEILWQGHPNRNPGDAGVGLVGLLVLFAALGATARGRPVEIRLLHLMPVAYLAMLILVQARASYVFAPRYLYPAVPLACMLGAMLFHYAAPPAADRKKLASPWFALLVLAVGLAFTQLLLPLLSVRPWAEGLLPMAALSATGWESSRDFVASTLLPVLLLITLCGLGLLYRQPRSRIVLLSLAVGLALGPYFGSTVDRLGRRATAQRADNFLYPLRAFQEQLTTVERGPLLLTGDLVRGYDMCGPAETCPRIVRLAAQRPFKVLVSQARGSSPSLVMGTVAELPRLARDNPQLRERAVLDPAKIVFAAELDPAAVETLSRAERLAKKRARKARQKR